MKAPATRAIDGAGWELFTGRTIVHNYRSGAIMASKAAADSRCRRSAETAALGNSRPWAGRIGHPCIAVLFVFAALVDPSWAGPSSAPPDPLLPLIHRVEGFLRRGESAGVTMDPRFPLNPPEVARLSVVCQLLGYADLYLASRNHSDLDHVVTRADFLVARFDQVTSRTVFDGMLGYALLSAYELTGDPRYFEKGALVTARVLHDLPGARLNWGLMGGMCLAKYYDLTGDISALDGARSLVAALPGYQNPDGSFPHYCYATEDVHYTGWLAMELIVIRRFLDDPVIDSILSRINGFLRARVDSTGNTQYTNCGQACTGDADGDGVCEEYDACPGTPGGCAVDPQGCEMDADQDGICDQGCLRDDDLDGTCDEHDRCPGTPQGCGVDRFGCELDANGDGYCDTEQLRPCSQYYSLGSGCRIDYETRGWINELGYSAMVFDRFSDPDYHSVMGFLYDLTSHGEVPDKWDHFPLPTDPIYPWASREGSVARTSVVFWSLAEIYWARTGRMSVRFRAERPRASLANAIDREVAAGPPVAAVSAGPRGYLTVDSLVVTGAARPEGPDPAGAPSDASRGTKGSGGKTTSPGNPPVASPASPGGSRATVRYRLASDANLSASVFDLAGRRLAEWELGRVSRGAHELVWDCRDRSGQRVAPGLYWVRIRAGSWPIATGRWIVPR
jgi:hypothetical protein